MPKTKYPVELRVEIVEKYLQGKESQNSLSRNYGISQSDIRKWIDAYEEHGIAGLCTTHGSYTGEFKVSVIEYMHNMGTSARKTAAHFNIPSYVTVCKWERIYLNEGVEALWQERRGRAKNMDSQSKKSKKLNKETEEDLIAEVQRLRMENEYLKKLNALVQKRIQRENGKKPPSSKN